MGASERRSEIIRILCRRRHETIANLAEEFGVSTRTILRDIEVLSATEPIYTLCGRYGGVFITDDYVISKMYMTEAELSVAKYVLWECNLYENKLFQDTTVESMNPSSNNAFGSTGFIGNTSLYGEQWLYSRLDYSRMPEMMDKHINKAILHIPKLNYSTVEFSAFKVAARFCSFGSNWNNKITSSSPISDSSSNSGYQNVDLTSLFVNPRTRIIIKSEGLILKSKIKGSGFSAITTADSYFAPQILEINFR